MHELSLLESVVSIAKNKSEGKITRIQKITLEYHLKSGINRDCLLFAWPEVVKNTSLENSELELIEINTSAPCSRCGVELKSDHHQAYCENCGIQHLDIHSSSDLILKSIQGV